MSKRRAMVVMFAEAMLIGILLGLGSDVYCARHNLSRSRVFEQMRIGLTTDATVKILMDNNIRCDISMGHGNNCWFSDFWRDDRIGIDPDTQTVDRLSYINRMSGHLF